MGRAEWVWLTLPPTGNRMYTVLHHIFEKYASTTRGITRMLLPSLRCSVSRDTAFRPNKSGVAAPSGPCHRIASLGSPFGQPSADYLGFAMVPVRFAIFGSPRPMSFSTIGDRTASKIAKRPGVRWEAIAPHRSGRSDPLLFLDPSGFVKNEFASNKSTNHGGERYKAPISATVSRRRTEIRGRRK